MVSRAMCLLLCFVIVVVASVLILPACLVGVFYGTRYVGRYSTDWHRRAAAAS